MEQFHGVGVTPGRVVGRVRQMPAPVAEPAAGPVSGGLDAALEGERIRSASKAVQAALKARAASASGDAKGVLEATALMAADPMLVKGAVKLLDASADGGARSAERAVWESGAAVAEKLKSLGGYMAERAADVDADVGGRGSLDDLDDLSLEYVSGTELHAIPRRSKLGS